MPVAVSCCVVPTANIGITGKIVMDVRIGAGTVTFVDPLTPAAVAVIVDVPCAKPATLPLFVTSLLTSETFVEDELHRTEDKTCVAPPLNVPVAVRSCCVPIGMDGPSGETEMLVKPVSLV